MVPRFFLLSILVAFDILRRQVLLAFKLWGTMGGGTTVND